MANASSVALVHRTASIERASDEKPIRPTNDKMLIPPIQSKWDAGLQTVLGPWVSHRNTLRKANGRADNPKP
jgi:hypothetical protein